MDEQIMRAPDLVMVSYEGGEFRGQPEKDCVRFDDVIIKTSVRDDGVHILLAADQTPVRMIKLRWKMSVPEDVRFLGDAWERTYGDAMWSGMVPYRAMPWYFMMQAGGSVTGCGVKVRSGALCFWQADPAGLTLWLDVRCGGEGVVLGGRELTCAVVVTGTWRGISAFKAAREFCRLMCTDPVFPEEPVYGSNNWYYAYGKSSAEEILADTDYVASLTEGLENRPFMVVDDCWEVNLDNDYNGGPWDAGNRYFPDMPLLIKQIKEKNVKPGVWFRPLLDNSKDIPDEWRLPAGTLDPSHPAVLARVNADITRLCEWGFQLIKHDFSTYDCFGKWGFQMQPFPADDGWHFYDRGKTSAEILVNFYRTIYEAALPFGSLILGCNTVGHLAAGLEHMQRTGDDTSGRYWERTLRMGVNTLAFRMPQHRTFFDIDADCLGDVGSMPWEYNRQWGELLAKSGTPFFFSIRPGAFTDRQTEEMKAFLAEASRQGVTCEPLDWQNTPYPQRWRCAGKEYHFDWYQDTGLKIPAGPGADWEIHTETSAF